MNSGTVCAGKLGSTSITSGTRNTPANRGDIAHEIKRQVRKQRSVNRVLGIHQKQRVAIRRCARDLLVAILPVAPGRTSTMNCWSRCWERNWEMSRAVISDELAAACPTITWTGRVG